MLWVLASWRKTVKWIKCEKKLNTIKQIDFQLHSVIFSLATSIIQFFMPCIIIYYCYLRILLKLKRNSRRMGKHRNKKLTSTSRKSSRNSTNKMLISIISIFTVCWAPLNSLNLVDDFSDMLSENEYYTFIFFTSHLFAMSSVLYNPFIYTFNQSWRKEYKKLFCSSWKKWRSKASIQCGEKCV